MHYQAPCSVRFWFANLVIAEYGKSHPILIAIMPLEQSSNNVGTKDTLGQNPSKDDPGSHLLG